MQIPLRVLLVEDFEDDALLVLRALKQGGFTLQWQRVDTLADLEQALAQQPSWDVIISDFRLPEFSAKTALETLKRHQLDIPFIVVSGTIGERVAVDLMRAGAQDYLRKDNLVRLPEAVRRELREWRTRAKHTRAEMDLATAQERLQLAVESSGLGTWDWYIRTGEFLVDEQCLRLMGHSPQASPPLCIHTWQGYLHPDDFRARQTALIQHFKGESETYECEFRLHHCLGHWVWILERGRVVERDAMGRSLRMAGTRLDISDRKQNELRQALQNSILERIAQLDPLPDILQDLVLVAEAHLEGAMGSIMVCDGNSRLRHGASPHLPPCYSQALDGMLIGGEAGSCGTAAFCRDIVIVADISTSPLWQDFKPLALSYGLQSCWSAPAVGSNDQVLATCAVYFTEPRRPQPQELALLTLVADIAKIAIERHRAAMALTKRDRYLNVLVQVQNLLLASSSLNVGIYQTVLAMLGPVAEVDRIYIFENQTAPTGELCTSQRAEWCGAGIAPQIDNPELQNLPYSDGLQRWQQILSRGERIQGNIADFPPSEQPLLESQGICSILVLPLLVQESFWGFIGVDHCQSSIPWDPLEIWLLSSVAAAFALAQEREIANRALTQLNHSLEDRIQKRTAALQDSEAKLQAILNFAPASIYVKDLDGRHMLANQAMLKFLALSSVELLGKRNENIFEPETATRLTANDRLVMAAGQVQQFEETIDHKGKTYTFLSHKFLLFDQNQQPYAICGISSDITDRKTIQATLRRKETYLSHIATNVPGVIFQYMVSPTGDQSMAYISSCCQEVFELEPAAVQADIHYLLDLVHPDDVDPLQQSIAQFLRDFQPWTWEGRIITPSGQQKWIQGIAQPEPMADGGALCDGLLLDITDRKAAELLLQKTNAELARATRLKDEFLANMSHELRTPLNAVLGIAEGLQAEVFGALTDRQNKALDTIRESGQHLLDLINDVLDFSKIEADKLELSVEQVSIRTVGETSLRFVQPLAFKKRIAMEFSLPAPLQGLEIAVDERRLRQTLINLLNNAVKFTPEGGRVELAIRMEVHQPRPPLPLAGEPVILPALCFTVSDTGIGIAPDQLDRLFKSFVQIDSTLNRQYNGTGLGLALVKRLVNLHGGTVGVSSIPGRGSCFAVRLPCADFDTSIEAARTDGAAHYVNNNCGVPLHHHSQLPLILLAAHDRAEMHTFTSYLEAKKYRVLTTQDTAKILPLIRAKRPDLLLVDASIPNLDEVLAQGQPSADLTQPFMPIMVMTELANSTDREKWEQSGVRACLKKPVKLKVLVATIQQLLDEIKNLV